MSLSFGSHVLTKPSVQIHFPPLPVIMCVFALIVAGMLPSALQRAQGRSPDSSSSFIPLNPPIGIVMFDQVGASVTDVPAYHAVIALQYNIQNVRLIFQLELFVGVFEVFSLHLMSRRASLRTAWSMSAH
jgi:hypothetical protein